MSAAEYRILFMVRHPYYDAIVAGTKTFELRRGTERWKNMGGRALMDVANGSPATAVFMCGRRVHRRRFLGVRLERSAEAALGRPPTTEELAFLGDGEVVRFALGEVVP